MDVEVGWMVGGGWVDGEVGGMDDGWMERWWDG